MTFNFENEKYATDINNSKEFVDEVMQNLNNLEDKIINTGPIRIENDLGSKVMIHSFDPSDWNFEIAKVDEIDLVKLKSAMQEMSRIIYKEGELEEKILNLINLFRSNRSRLVALMMLEVGKPLLEADAEIAEAIDFCNYYLNLRDSISNKELFSDSEERTILMYEPRGITCVISPWNFPIAIPTGMIVANLIVGNPVVFKPAEQAVLLGYELHKLFLEAGWNNRQILFAPGYGETVGEYLVKSSMVETIMFTGSKAVGARIIELSSKHPSKNGFKRVIAEMGGKNSIYVHRDADVDLAVNIITTSAFGYAGQKCSACSKVYVHRDISSALLPKLVDATQTIRVGTAKEVNTILPYVIDRDAYHRLWNILQQSLKEGLILTQSSYPESNAAAFIPATILYMPSESSIYATEELFGPILCYFEVSDFDEALSRINSVEYALTGGIITNSNDIIQKGIAEFNCGNLYVNRKITGALVGRHPFGGRKFSGTGFKAGGPSYLLQLVNEKSVSFSNLNWSAER